MHYVFFHFQPTVQSFNSHTENIAQRILGNDKSNNFPNIDDTASEVHDDDQGQDGVQQESFKGLEEEDEEDPLSFIQIKSAAQWKAVSKRISWNFDDASETATTVSQNLQKSAILGSPLLHNELKHGKKSILTEQCTVCLKG